MNTNKTENRLARKRRVRAKISGTPECPRMSIFRSLSQMSVQIIDDESGKTVASATTVEIKKKPNMDGAKALGELIAKKAKDAKISTVIFDRNGYKYHGRVKAVADAARDAGLTF